MVLTVSFIYSYVTIRKALVSNKLNMSMNKQMLTLNIFLIMVIFLSETGGWILYGRSRYAFTIAISIETYARVLIKIVFLTLLESFG
jgi:cadmium resistance protein CadD (predicted permease)